MRSECPRPGMASLALSLLAVALLAGIGAATAALPPDLEREFARMPQALQQQLRERQAQLEALPPAARAALQARRSHWDALPLAERAELREHWEAWRALPPAQQQALRDSAAALAALPPERQRELRLQFDQLSVDEQRGWLLGPNVGAAWMHLQPLLMQVPGSERAELLATLQAMPPSELQDLAILAQRTPPQERAALRRDLIQSTASNRAAWLRLRLAR